MILIHSFKSLGATFEARASEWALTGAVLSLSTVFMFNSSMFYSPSFAGLRDIIGSRYVWTMLLLIVGLLRLSVLCVNGMYWRTPHLRAITAFICSGVWFLFCMGFMQNGSLMIAVMPWVFALDAYNAKRASREAGLSESIHRHAKSKGLGENELGLYHA